MSMGSGIWKKGIKPNLNPALTVTSFTVFCFVPILIFSACHSRSPVLLAKKNSGFWMSGHLFSDLSSQFLLLHFSLYWTGWRKYREKGAKDKESQMDSQARWPHRGKRSSKPLLLLWTAHISMHLAKNMHPQKIGTGTSDFFQTAHCPSKVGAFYGDTMS